jgi:hypothetical protein
VREPKAKDGGKYTKRMDGAKNVKDVKSKCRGPVKCCEVLGYFNLGTNDCFLSFVRGYFNLN